MFISMVVALKTISYIFLPMLPHNTIQGDPSSELPPALLGLAGTPLHTAKSLVQSSVIAAVELMAPNDGMLKGSWAH